MGRRVCTWPRENCARFDSFGYATPQQGTPVAIPGADREVTADIAGTLVAMGGHLHPGGVCDEVGLVRGGSSVRSTSPTPCPGAGAGRTRRAAPAPPGIFAMFSSARGQIPGPGFPDQTVQQATVYPFTPGRTGTFQFFCRVHPAMRGVFEVVP